MSQELDQEIIDYNEHDFIPKALLIHTISKWVAWISGAMGVLILVSYIFTKAEDLALYGLVFLYIAGLVNVVFLLLIIIFFIVKPKTYKFGLKAMGWLLLNIPLAALCTWVGISMLN